MIRVLASSNLRTGLLRPSARVTTAAVSSAILLVPVIGAGPPFMQASPSTGSSRPAATTQVWSWPVGSRTAVIRGYEAPPTPYAAGHRGIDIGAVEGEIVRVPTASAVAFSGRVVDRDVVTLRTPEGVLVSFEPVLLRDGLAVGDPVARDAALGSITDGGDCASRCLHLGVRIDGDYVSPLLFLGGLERAVLLPLEG